MIISFDLSQHADVYLELNEFNDGQALKTIENLFSNTKLKKAKELIIIPNGKPQHVQMLLHYVTLHFPHKLRIQQKKLWKNPIVEHDTLYHVLHHLIESNRFVSAEILLKNKDRSLKNLLNFAKRLKYGESKFDSINNPDYYFKLFLKVMREDVQASDDELSFIEGMKDLQFGKQQPFSYFLQSYTNQLYKNTDLTDFIVMYYRLAEELLLYAMGWDATEYNHYTIRKNVTTFIPLPQKSEIVSRHFNSYMNYLKKQNSPYSKQVYDRFNEPWLISLIQLRHDGLSGHGYEPYSHAMINRIIGEEPMEKMNELLKLYNIQMPFCFFTLLKTAMAARAKHLESTI